MIKEESQYTVHMGGTVGSCLVCSTPEWAVWVQALAGDIVLCSWARHLTLTVPFSTQVYKGVPANCWGNVTNCREVAWDGLASRPGEVEILLAASCYRNRNNLRQLRASLGSKASFTSTLYTCKVENISLGCKHLCSKGLKGLKFQIIGKWNLSFQCDDRLWISAVISDISRY